MEQVIFGGYDNLLPTVDTEYNSLNSGWLWGPTEAHFAKVVSSDGVFKNLRVVLSGAPEAGKKYTFTLMLNGAPTALTFDIADAAVSGSNMVNEIDVAPGNTVSLQCDPDNTPTAVTATWTCVFKGDTAKESLLLGGTSSNLSNIETEFTQVVISAVTWSLNESDYRQIIPTAGTIKNFYVKLSEDPGTDPDGYKFTLRKGTPPGAQGDTALTVTITADDTTGSDLVNSVDVVPGDAISLKCEPLNGPSAPPQACWGMTFVADIDGESIVIGGTAVNLNPTDTRYNHIVAGSSWHLDETVRYHLGQICILKKLHVLLSGAPSAGDNYQFTVRLNGADSELGCIIENLETTGQSSVSAKADIANDDIVDLQVVPTSSPDVADGYWGLVCYTGPAIEPKYTPKIATFSIGVDGAWTDYDLFTNQGVPKGRIAEIVCCNKNEDFARIVGVRTDNGNGLNRYIDLHEAENLGATTATMFVKCHETTGLIECYSEIQGDVEFKLKGYFTADVDFTELITSLGEPPTAWADKDLTASGVPDNAVVQILMGNDANAADFFAGVRANESGIERGVVLDEAEGGGWSTLSMVVQSDAGAVIEWKGVGVGKSVNMWLLGWFSSNVTFTEDWDQHTPAGDNTWESVTITDAVADAVVVFALVHEDSGSETFCGLREKGSVLARMIEEHEAEGGAFSGFQACILVDGDKKCEVYCEDASESDFRYSGYFTITVGGQTYERTVLLDALLKKAGITKSVDLDVALQTAGVTKSVDLDVVIQKIIQKSVDLDTVLKALGVERSVDLDTALQKLGIERTVDLDIALQTAGLTKSVDLDVALQEAGLTKSVDLDVVLQVAGITKTVDLDTVLKALGVERTVLLDLLLKLRTQKSVDLDVVLQAIIERTVILDVILKAEGIERTVDLDVLLKLRDQRTVLLDLLLKALGVQRSVDLDVVIQEAGIEKSVDIDVLIKALGITMTVDLDVALQKLAIERSVDLDMVLKAVGVQRTVDLDTVIKATGVIRTVDLDVVLQVAGITKTVDLDTVLMKVGVLRTVLLDVLLQEAGVTTYERTVLLDLLLKALEVTKTVDIDVALKKLGVERTVLLDILFKALGVTRSVDLDTVLQTAGITKSVDLDLLIKAEGIQRTVDLDTLLKLRSQKSVDLDVLLQNAGIEKSVDLDLLIKAEGIERTVDLDVLLKLRAQRTVLMDMITKALGVTRSVDMDVALQKTGITRTFTLDVVLSEEAVEEVIRLPIEGVIPRRRRRRPRPRPELGSLTREIGVTIYEELLKVWPFLTRIWEIDSLIADLLQEVYNQGDFTMEAFDQTIFETEQLEAEFIPYQMFGIIEDLEDSARVRATLEKIAKLRKLRRELTTER